MPEDSIVSSRPDREIRKKIVTPGDYNLVPYEESRCKIVLSEIKCTNEAGPCAIEKESRIFSAEFDGNVLIGDLDCFIDKDVELILQQMCNEEVCDAVIAYKDGQGQLVKELSFRIHLKETTEEQLISDWSWQRLHECAVHHKETGVGLVKENRIPDAFRRFSKSLKMLIAVEPIDPEVVPEDAVKEMIDLKVKLYNNLCHCQLQFSEYDAALQLCNKALQYDKDNIKAIYRRCQAHAGLEMYEEAWKDIQHVLKMDPNDKTAQKKAAQLKPHMEIMKKKYSNVIKKMFE